MSYEKHKTAPKKLLLHQDAAIEETESEASNTEVPMNIPYFYNQMTTLDINKAIKNLFREKIACPIKQCDQCVTSETALTHFLTTHRLDSGEAHRFPVVKNYERIRIQFSMSSLEIGQNICIGGVYYQAPTDPLIRGQNERISAFNKKLPPSLFFIRDKLPIYILARRSINELKQKVRGTIVGYDNNEDYITFWMTSGLTTKPIFGTIAMLDDLQHPYCSSTDPVRPFRRMDDVRDDLGIVNCSKYLHVSFKALEALTDCCRKPYMIEVVIHEYSF